MSQFIITLAGVKVEPNWKNPLFVGGDFWKNDETYLKKN